MTGPGSGVASVNDPTEIERALRTAKTVAVVGCSPDPARPSNAIARYLIEAGFQVFPVNPREAELLGRTCYPSLGAIPSEVVLDIVDVFRRSEHVPGIAAAALERHVGFFWMQEGIVHAEAARMLVEAGIPVAMDRCIYKEREALGRRVLLS